MWITLAGITVQNANAATNPAAIGAVPITGIHGALHAALRTLGHNKPALGFIVRVHDLTPRLVSRRGFGTGTSTTFQGRVYAKPVPQKKDMMGGPNDPLPKMDFRLSIAAEVEGNVAAEELKQALRSQPFCGGHCVSIGSALITADLDDALDTLHSSGAGLMLADETPAMLTHAKALGDSGLAALADLLGPNEMSARRKMAIGIGYRMLSEPSLKPDARSADTPHAFAEPLLGYAELHPLGEAEDSNRALIWRPVINRSLGTCILKGTPLCL